MGPPGPPGPAGSTEPQSTTLTRDANSRVQSVTVEGQSAWVISRNPDGSVARAFSERLDRCGGDRADGIVTGTTVTDL